MKEKQTITKDDVARLTRGKASYNRCGSRQMRHRLRLDELERLSIARSRGYLLITRSTRTALKNSWYLDCVARAKPCIYLERTEAGFLLSGLDDENQPVIKEITHSECRELFTTLPNL
jgi:hypothetical protein